MVYNIRDIYVSVRSEPLGGIYGWVRLVSKRKSQYDFKM